MGEIKKAVNTGYLQPIQRKRIKVNELNRAYIDRFVSLNYERLKATFAKYSGLIDSSGFDSLDKLNETLFSLYTDQELCFANWDEANRYLKNRFTAKAMRVETKPQESGENAGNGLKIDSNACNQIDNIADICEE